jgi:diacylglycerol kinase (ATP)
VLHGALAGRRDVVVCAPRGPEQMAAVTAEALRDGCDTLVAAGGDGTIHAAVNALAPDFDRVCLGVLPLGTGNDFARTLALPTDPLEALAVALGGPERRLDVIRVETPTRTFWCVNVAAGGFTGQMQEALTDDVKAWWGPLAYVRGAASVLPNLTGYQTSLCIDDGPLHQVEALNVIVANGRSAGGGLHVAPRANPEDGLLDLVVVRYAPVLDLTAVAALLLTGDYLDSDQVQHQTARRVRVAATPGMWFSIDGELLTNEPVTFTVVPRALRVRVGPPYSPEPPAAGA